ncbi:MAG TPA: intradiol ring-cleavage dioxygenase [Noviherbaspirillum sp.]|nr:intradiol ring-cleavage dioxygenase [Noviherbaspirillum sp.]
MKHDEQHSEMRRRTMLALLGGAFVGSGVAPPGARAAAPACVLAPRQPEGPFFVDTRLQRSDIRSGTSGVPLTLRLRVVDADRDCAAVHGLALEVWHCDPRGLYSGVRDPRAGLVEGDFLRGYQITDAQGIVQFTTVYPGWYRGRAVHVHIKLRDRQREWSSQLYFDDRITDQVHAREPYRAGGGRRTRNEDDGLYRHGGERLMLALAPEGGGYAAQFELGVIGLGRV